MRHREGYPYFFNLTGKKVKISKMKLDAFHYFKPTTIRNNTVRISPPAIRERLSSKEIRDLKHLRNSNSRIQ